MKRLVISILLTVSGSLLAADPSVVPAAELAKKWMPKRTKSVVQPVEKLRKGLSLETGSATPQALEVKVDADTEERFQNIQFALNSNQLEGPSTFAQLNEIAKAMAMAGTEKFLIEGHTCDLGELTHNAILSQQRAIAVRNYLIAQGVAPARLQIIGFGETDPATPNVSEDARKQNRRVQIFRKL